MTRASIEYDFKTPASSSHDLITSTQGTAINEGLFDAISKFEGFTTEMDRDIIVLVDTEEPNQPKVVIEKGEDGSIAGLVSIVPKI